MYNIFWYFGIEIANQTVGIITQQHSAFIPILTLKMYSLLGSNFLRSCNPLIPLCDSIIIIATPCTKQYAKNTSFDLGICLACRACFFNVLWYLTLYDSFRHYLTDSDIIWQFVTGSDKGSVILDHYSFGGCFLSTCHSYFFVKKPSIKREARNINIHIHRLSGNPIGDQKLGP